jgi:hypothetical protein
MPLANRKSFLRRAARIPASLRNCRHIAWDGHALSVISKFDVLRG